MYLKQNKEIIIQLNKSVDESNLNVNIKNCIHILANLLIYLIQQTTVDKNYCSLRTYVPYISIF